VPECQELRRAGIGHPLRLFDILRGTKHVLVAFCPGAELASASDELASFAANARQAGWLRTAIVIEPGTMPVNLPGLNARSPENLCPVPDSQVGLKPVTSSPNGLLMLGRR